MSEILGIDTNNYAVQSLKSSGGGSATLQEKSVTITTNGTTNATPDSGYDGLSKVNITTNVQPNLQNKQVSITTNTTTNIQADSQYDGLGNVEVTTNIQPNLQNKSVTITENTTTTIQADSGYDGLGTVEVTTNVAGDVSEYFGNILTADGTSAKVIIKKIPTNVSINGTNMNTIFDGFKGLVEVPLLDTSNITLMRSSFRDCNIVSIPQFDTSNVTDIQQCFLRCHNLINVPLLNFAKVTNLTSIFGLCESLSNDSLNNILAMCIGATSYTGTKTLSTIGLNATQIAICQTLSNWNDFVNAGWSA